MEPLERNTGFPFNTEPPKKSRLKKWLQVLAVLFALVIAIGAGALWLVSNYMVQKTSDIPDTTQQSDTSKTLQGSQNISGDLNVNKNATIRNNLMVEKDAFIQGKMSASSIETDELIVGGKNFNDLLLSRSGTGTKVAVVNNNLDCSDCIKLQSNPSSAQVGNINVAGNISANSVTVKSQDNTTNVLGVMSANGEMLLNVDSINKRVTVADLSPLNAGGVTAGSYTPAYVINNWDKSIIRNDTGYSYNEQANWVAKASDDTFRLVYTDQNTSDVMYVRCLDQSCATYTETVIASDPVNGLEYPSLALDSNDVPYISYMTYVIPNVYHIVRCSDTDCSTKTDQVVATTIGYGYTQSLTLGSNGLPRMIFDSHDYSSNEYKLVYLVCNDTSCSSVTETEIHDGSSWIGSGSITVSSSGTIYFAYVYNDQGILVRCINTDCTNRSTTYVDTANYYLDTAVQSNGIPLMIYESYNANGDKTVKLAQCTTTDCSSMTSKEIAVGSSPTLDIASDGSIRIAYNFEETLYHIYCNDNTCADPEISALGSSHDYGGNSVIVGSDGFSRLANFTSESPRSLEFYTLTSNSGSTYIPAVINNAFQYNGTSIGSGNAPFGQIYAQGINLQTATAGSALLVNQIGAVDGTGKVASFQINGIERASIENDGSLHAERIVSGPEIEGSSIGNITLNASGILGNLLQVNATTGENIFRIQQDGNLVAGGTEKTQVGELPKNAVPVYTYAKNSYPTASAISDGHMFVVGEDTFDLEVLSLANPVSPKRVGTVGTGSSNKHAHDVEVQGDYAYVSRLDPNNALEIYDVSDPTKPKMVSSTVPNPNFDIFDLEVIGRYVYASTRSALVIYDVINPSAPVILSTITLGDSPWSNTQLEVSGNYAYVYKGNPREFYVVDISNPSAPVVSDMLPIGNLSDINIFNESYETDTNMIKIGDAVYITNTGLDVDNGYASYKRIISINVTDPTSVAVSNTLELPHTAFSGGAYLMVEGVLYFMDSRSLYTLNTSDPMNPTVRSQTMYDENIPTHLASLAYKDGYFYANYQNYNNTENKLYVLMNTNKAAFQELEALTVSTRSDAKVGGKLEVAGNVTASGRITVGSTTIKSNGLITNDPEGITGIQVITSNLNYYKDPAQTTPVKGIGAGTVASVTGQSNAITGSAALITPSNDETSLRFTLPSLGQITTLSFTAWTTNGTADLRFLNESSGYIYNDIDVGIASTAPKRYTVSYYSYGFPTDLIASNTTGVYIADMQFELGDTASSFFYGGTGIGYKWQGAVNNSYSERVSGFFSNVTSSVIQNTLSTNQTIVRQKNGASLDLAQYQDATGTVLSRITSAGQYSGSTATLSSNLTIGSNTAQGGAIRLANGAGIYNRNSANSADVITIRVASDNLTYVSNGALALSNPGGTTTAFLGGNNGNLTIGNGVTDGGSKLYVKNGGAAVVAFTLQGAASQTADLLQAKNSTGTTLASISASGSLLVQSAIINGTLTINGKIITGGSAPVVASNASAGTGATVAVTGNDTSGRITVTTGTSGMAAGTLATLTYNSAYAAAPRIVLTPVGNVSASLQYNVGASNTGNFTLNTNNAPLASTTYVYYYQIMQ